jgi:hypothetical protein
MSIVDIETVQAHLREIPRGLRYIDALWAAALEAQSVRKWAEVDLYLSGAIDAIGPDHPQIDDYRTLRHLSHMHIECIIRGDRP